MGMTQTQKILAAAAVGHKKTQKVHKIPPCPSQIQHIHLVKFTCFIKFPL